MRKSALVNSWRLPRSISHVNVLDMDSVPWLPGFAQLRWPVFKASAGWRRGCYGLEGEEQLPADSYLSFLIQM